MGTNLSDINHKNIILFDGVCNLCNSSVDFIVRRDKRGIFKFASLQSELGQAILKENHLPADDFQSVLLVQNGKIYQKSMAALMIARQLSGLWFLMYGFVIIPAFLRNWIYNLIAQNRYKLFGKKESCRMPTLEERSRFL